VCDEGWQKKMSYMRYGYPLRYFKTGKSKSYVFVSGRKYGPDYVSDYNDEYKDNRSFCELIGKIILHETKDEDYAWKMVRVLAKKLGIQKQLRKKPLAFEEEVKLIFKEQKRVDNWSKNSLIKKTKHKRWARLQ
jgi:hypothetical protein